ncbi:MAG: hypothetical protein EA399_13965 [Desulfovibrionales bacterium]|nr:MAG: hypothetical protein EA399_13965 [Desulfovibrionales bacterium]
MVIFLSFIFGEKIPEIPLRCIEKVPGHKIMLCLSICNFRDSLRRECLQGRARIGQQDGGMGGDDELGVAGDFTA